MSDNFWKSVFRKQARQERLEEDAGEETERCAGSSMRGGVLEDVVEGSRERQGVLLGDESERRTLSDIELSTGMCRTMSAKAHLDLLAKMKDSLENIWVSLMIGKNVKLRNLMICGATKGEGATFLSFYLSLFLSQEYRRKVLYIDTDVSGGGNEIFDSDHNEGILAFFDKGVPLDCLVCPTEFEGLYVLSGSRGAGRSNAMSIIWHRTRLSAMVAFCREHFDVAVFDGQPVVFNPAMIEYARAVDQVLLVCRYGQSRREVAQLAVDKLADSGANLSGVILNAREYPVPPKVYKILG